jgi:hypothetical protein
VFTLSFVPANKTEEIQVEKLKENLYRASTYLKIASRSVHKYLMNLTRDEFSLKFQEYFKFSQYPQVTKKIVFFNKSFFFIGLINNSMEVHMSLWSFLHLLVLFLKEDLVTLFIVNITIG